LQIGPKTAKKKMLKPTPCEKDLLKRHGFARLTIVPEERAGFEQLLKAVRQICSMA